MDNRPVFGIDLGTTNSAISVVRTGNKAECIPLRDDKDSPVKYTMPSCVMWKDGKFIVGTDAYNNRDKENVCYSIKRVIQEPEATFTFVDGDKELVMTAVDISCEILKGLVEKTGGDYGDVNDVIITVPAYFNQIGKDNTRAAAIKAGLNPIDIINEPTAAALLYDISSEKETDVVVYDLGGGTFDVTLARITPTANDVLAKFYNFDDSDDIFPANSVRVLASDGDSELGGDDIDKDMLKIVLKKLKGMGYDTKKIPDSYREYMLLQLEQLKKKNAEGEYSYYVGCRCKDGSTIETNVRIVPDDFKKAVKPSMEKTFSKLDHVLTSVPHSCTTIVLVGGSTQNPWIRNELKKRYGKRYSINYGFDADRSVAEGASIYGKSVKFGNAAVEVFDIISLPIGVATEGGTFDAIVGKGMPLPASGDICLTTSVDNQTDLPVKLYQGDKKYVDDCVYLGELTVSDIPPAPAGEPNIYVSVHVSNRSILTCTATINGVTKELPPLDLGGRRTNVKTLDRESKRIVKWKRLVDVLSKEGQTEIAEQLSNLLTRLESGEDVIEEITTLLEDI